MLQFSGTSSIPRSRPTSAKTHDPFPTLDLDKKEKKNFKIGNFKPFKKDKNKNKVIKNDLKNTNAVTAGGASSQSPTSSAGAAVPIEELNHMKLASEASKKAENDRLERLRRQEEHDLAYAIALSKAEAASVKQQ